MVRRLQACTPWWDGDGSSCVCTSKVAEVGHGECVLVRWQLISVYVCLPVGKQWEVAGECVLVGKGCGRHPGGGSSAKVLQQEGGGAVSEKALWWWPLASISAGQLRLFCKYVWQGRDPGRAQQMRSFR